MNTPPDRRPFTNALVGLIAGGTGHPTYDEGSVPPDVKPPFTVVTPVGGQAAWGPSLGEEHTTPEMRYQVSCAGLRRDQAEALLDRARRTIVAREPSGEYQVPIEAPEPWAIAERCLEADHGVVQEGEAPNAVWTAVADFALKVCPA